MIRLSAKAIKGGFCMDEGLSAALFSVGGKFVSEAPCGGALKILRAITTNIKSETKAKYDQYRFFKSNRGTKT